MYLRETKRRNADGSTVSYLALAQNERDPETGVPRARIIHRFGRADEVDREALARLVRSISRFLDPSRGGRGDRVGRGTDHRVTHDGLGVAGGPAVGAP